MVVQPGVRVLCFFFQAEDGIRDSSVTGVQTCALPISAQAVADSGCADGLKPHRTGVTVGSAVGATMGLDQEYRVVSDGGRLHLVDHEYAVPHLYGYFVPSSFAAEVAWQVGAEGPTTVVSTGSPPPLPPSAYPPEPIPQPTADLMIA